MKQELSDLRIDLPDQMSDDADYSILESDSNTSYFNLHPNPLIWSDSHKIL